MTSSNRLLGFVFGLVALLADFALFGCVLAALVVALFTGFHGCFTTRLFLIRSADGGDAEQGEGAGGDGQ